MHPKNDLDIVSNFIMLLELSDRILLDFEKFPTLSIFYDLGMFEGIELIGSI